MANPDDGTGTLSFGLVIRPILSEHCFPCHGPDANSRKADLRLDLRGQAEAVLVEEDGLESELVYRIESDDPLDQMPPPEAKNPLTESEVGLLKAWIAQGATYDQHWSFRPIHRPGIPEIEEFQRDLNPIDRFILARLESEGLEPRPEASRETLIRRLSFDLLGLPPTIPEIEAFLNDKGPDAYERLVDRLLDRPEFGERMAADWLDLARYSDTYGYQVDRERFVWPWRDWVINAFNQNMPYDQFLTWQLAGDCLPNASDEQILATTFNRLHPQKVEGGSVPEEFRVEYVADRTNTVSTAFLGLTLECARCHDHKYDPISQREYYQLFAFFNNIDEAGLYSYFTQSVPTPTLKLLDSGTKGQLSDLREAINQAEDALSDLDQQYRDQLWIWVTHTVEDGLPENAIPGEIGYLSFDETMKEPHRSVPGKIGNAVQLNGDDAIQLEVGNFRRFEPFSVALWLNPPDVKERAVVFHRSRAWTDAGSRGYQLLLEEGRLSASLIHFWPGNAIRVRAIEPLPTNHWSHVAITYDGSSRADGLKILLDGQPIRTEVVRDSLTKNITGGGGDQIAIGARFRDRGFTGGLVDEFRVFDRRLTTLEVAELAGRSTIEDQIRGATVGEQLPSASSLLEYYREVVDPEYRELLERLQSAREQYCKLEDSQTEIMVMREQEDRRLTFLLERGAYDAPAEAVLPLPPSILPPMPVDPTKPNDRLDLANWLTSDEHPLTARVAVNRFWQICFGRGLVRTPEDFGSQGEPPTHPELLDWLAAEFRSSGWDLKRMIKLIVCSATYRQDSVTSEELRRIDPSNKRWARFPSYRLPAEMIRDNALGTSGLLVRTIGGPPAKPYELAASFKPINPDNGQGLYRRSLYTYWKRTAPAPVLMTLDASKRDVCTVNRERTATPLQALVLLNDPQLIEAARKLGERTLRQVGIDPDPLVTSMTRSLWSRSPSDAELRILRDFYQRQQKVFADDPEAARQFLETGNTPIPTDLPLDTLAASGMVANLLMNFDACVTKR